MANGIIEKSRNGLFENEIECNGKYSKMIRFLKDEIQIFSTFREAYVLAMVVGFLNNKKETADDSEKVSPASVFPNELSKRKRDLRIIYRIIMLLDEDGERSIEDCMNRAFRDDANEEDYTNLRLNMEVINSYACGGLEFLYEKFKDARDNDEVIDLLYDFVHELSEDVGINNVSLPSFDADFS